MIFLQTLWECHPVIFKRNRLKASPWSITSTTALYPIGDATLYYKKCTRDTTWNAYSPVISFEHKFCVQLQSLPILTALNMHLRSLCECNTRSYLLFYDFNKILSLVLILCPGKVVNNLRHYKLWICLSSENR